MFLNHVVFIDGKMTDFVNKEITRISLKRQSFLFYQSIVHVGFTLKSWSYISYSRSCHLVLLKDKSTLVLHSFLFQSSFDSRLLNLPQGLFMQYLY